MVFHEWEWCFSSNLDVPQFAANNLPEVEEYVRASYNHPCVCAWSLSNEVRVSSNPALVVCG